MVFKKHTDNGFTLIEILVVISIFFIFLALLITPFILLNREQALTGSTLIVKSALSEARSKTISSENDTRYGVHFEEGENVIVLFRGPSYSSGDPDNVNVPLHAYIRIDSVDLAGSASSVLFNRLSGATAQAGEIILVEGTGDDAKYKTITIFSTGVVE